MRIGIDFDGTIADTTATKIRYALEVFGESITPVETFGLAGRGRLGDQRYVEMVQAAHQGWTHQAPPMPGALEAMRRLAVAHDLYVVTARNEDEVGPARQWLREFAVPAVEIVHTAGASKVDACRDLDVALMLDDLPTVLGELVGAGIEGALLETPYNRDLERHERLYLVPSWDHFVALAERLSATPAVR